MTDHPSAPARSDAQPLVAPPTSVASPRRASENAPAPRRPAGLDAAPPPFARLLRVELRKAVDTLTGRWLLGLTGALVVGALAIAVAVRSDSGADLHSLLTTALVPVALLLPVLGVLLMTGEFSTRSLLVTFALVPSRGRVVAAKAAAAVVLAVVVTLLTGVLSAVALGGLDLAGEPVRWSVQAAVLGQLVVLQVVNVLVGVGFGLLFQSTLVGVVAFLVVPFLVGFVVLLVPSLREVAPWVDLTAGTGPLSEDAVAGARDWARVAGVTAVWAGIPAAAGWLRLRRREIA